MELDDFLNQCLLSTVTSVFDLYTKTKATDVKSTLFLVSRKIM
jgi:hypothetical protein